MSKILYVYVKGNQSNIEVLHRDESLTKIEISANNLGEIRQKISEHAEEDTKNIIVFAGDNIVNELIKITDKNVATIKLPNVTATLKVLNYEKCLDIFNKFKESCREISEDFDNLIETLEFSENIAEIITMLLISYFSKTAKNADILQIMCCSEYLIDNDLLCDMLNETMLHFKELEKEEENHEVIEMTHTSSSSSSSLPESFRESSSSSSSASFRENEDEEPENTQCLLM